MEIDRAAPVVSRHEIAIDAPAARVWQILTDVARWPDWNNAVTRATIAGPPGMGAVFRWRSGGATIVSTIGVFAPEREIGWTGVAFGTRAVHVWRLRPAAGGVTVETEESLSGWLVRLLPGMMRKVLDRTLAEWLAQLKAAAERRTG